MSQQIHVTAILTPSEGSLDRLTTLITLACKEVHAKEPRTLRYQMTTTINTPTPEIIFVETYESQEANDQHVTTPHFKELFAKMAEEKLLAKEPVILKSVAKAGFDLDRVLL